LLYNPTHAICYILKYIHFNIRNTKMLKNIFVNINKTLHVSVLFIRPFSGGPYALLCVVTILSSDDLRRCIFTWYVAVSVYHLFVFDALVSGRSVCELSFDNTLPRTKLAPL
jgi:hypothetical protein